MPGWRQATCVEFSDVPLNDQVSDMQRHEDKRAL